jgi:hypothetical protein
VHVGDLDGASQKIGKSWRANVTVTVHDEAHAAVSSATVSGTWSDGSSGSCTTDGAGACVVSSAKLDKTAASTIFTVDSVSHATLSYDAAANHDPDPDSDGTTITVSKEAAPPPPPPPSGPLHVGDLDGSSSKYKGKYWLATVTVTVHDSAHNPVDGVTVSGAFTGGGSASCTTDSSGTCSVRSSAASSSQSTITFAVGGLSHATLSYDATANHDPDGDSNGTTIDVSAP